MSKERTNLTTELERTATMGRVFPVQFIIPNFEFIHISISILGKKQISR